MKIVFICVNYFSDKETLRFVDAIFKQPAKDSVYVVVVDNTPREESDHFGNILQGRYKHICWIKSPLNLGYFGAARYGLEIFLKKNILPEWIIVSNVDLMFGDSEFLSRLHDFNCGRDIGIVAPSIRSALNNRDQNPFMVYRPSAMRMQFYKLLTKNYMLSSFYAWASNLKNRFLLPFKKSKAHSLGHIHQRIYAPYGSCILFNKTYFKKGGTLDYPCFLFGEEIYVAETARALDLQVIYKPELKIIHEEHVSTGKTKTRKMASYAADAAAYCADTFFIQKPK
ncbi:MAG: hypothetical protein KKD92_10155 [Proteobacteria bacterium]|nr:hypothetical protein [Pseudomonadota bacterium]